MARSSKRRASVGLALGSGGARGLAHIGVIHALQELDVPVHAAAGTSMGSLIGAALASDKLDAMHEAALALDWKRALYYFLEISFPRSGIIDGRRIVEFLRQHMACSDIADLPMPYAAVATDVLSGEEVVFREGDVVEAVRASIAIPGMFTPVLYDGHVLVDGGLVNPLPVNITRELGADFVIAVDVTRAPGSGMAPAAPAVAAPSPSHAHASSASRMLHRLNDKFRNLDPRRLPAARLWFPDSGAPNIFEVCTNAVRVVERQITLTRLKIEPPDLLLQPDVHGIGTLDFHKASEAIEAGRTAVLAQADELAGLRSRRANG